MTAPIEHDTWKAGCELRRLDAVARHLAGQQPGAPAFVPERNEPALSVADSIYADSPVDDEWARIEQNGFVQREDGTLRFRPLFFWPGMVAFVHPIEDSVNPGPNMRLWARFTLPVQSTTWTIAGDSFTGWNAGVTGAAVALIWKPTNESMTGENIIFPGTYSDSLPPGGAIVFHDSIGETNDRGEWRRLGSIHEYNGIMIPSFL